MMHIATSVFGVIMIITTLFFMPINSTDQVTDFKTLAEYVHYISVLVLGNLLIWVSALTTPR